MEASVRPAQIKKWGAPFGAPHFLIQKGVFMLESYPDVLTVPQLQDALGIGRSVAYSLLKNNTIKHFRIGKQIRIPKAYLLEYITDSCYDGVATRESALSERSTS